MGPLATPVKFVAIALILIVVAALFAPGRVPVIGRFAPAGRMPFQTDKAATGCSMAVRFVSADGAEWRTGMNNIPVFVVNTPQGFYEQSLASAPIRQPASRTRRRCRRLPRDIPNSRAPSRHPFFGQGAGKSARLRRD